MLLFISLMQHCLDFLDTGLLSSLIWLSGLKSESFALHKLYGGLLVVSILGCVKILKITDLKISIDWFVQCHLLCSSLKASATLSSVVPTEHIIVREHTFQREFCRQFWDCLLVYIPLLLYLSSVEFSA